MGQSACAKLATRLGLKMQRFREQVQVVGFRVWVLGFGVKEGVVGFSKAY